MSDKFGEPLTLTEFAPIDDEEKQSTVGQYISNFFSKFTRGPSNVDSSPTIESPDESQSNEVNQDLSSASIDSDAAASNTPVALVEGRSVLNPNVLKRISNLLALKNTVSSLLSSFLSKVDYKFISFRICKRIVIRN